MLVESEFRISANAMEVMLGSFSQDNYNQFKCLGDSGANVHIANKELQDLLVAEGYDFFPEKSQRNIQTVGKDNKLEINGWIKVGGFINVMAVVWKAHDNLLALVELANNGLGTIIRPRPNFDCFLYTEDLNEEKHNIIQMGMINPRNNLYYSIQFSWK